MYKVIDKEQETEFPSLDLAMKFAKELNVFVTIKSKDTEIVGMFGADSVKDGKCPDGIDYTWKKRRI